MTISKNVLLAGGVCVLVIVGAIVAFSSSGSTSPVVSEADTSSSMEYLSAEETESVYMDFLDLLNQEYMVSQMNSTDTADDLVSFMTELMKANSQLDNIISRATPYTSHENDVVEVAGKALVAGSMGVKKANTDFITYLRGLGNYENFDQSEMAYQFAAYRSGEVEAYKLMVMGTGQLSALAWHFATTENPTGPVPYTISKEQRERVLARIEYLFADAFVKDDKQHRDTATRNAVLFSVRSLRDNLIPDTYEEAASMEADI